MSTPSDPTLQVWLPPPGDRMTDRPLALSGGARYSSIDGLWILVTAATRPCPILKFSSWSDPGPALRAGWPGGKRVTTWWPAVSGLGSSSLTAGAEPAASGALAESSARPVDAA